VAGSANPTAAVRVSPEQPQDDGRTLHRVIELVSSSLELTPVLDGVVDLATEATGCHACFIYLLEGRQLTIRAASPVFSDAVGKVQFSIEEGLTGWVARQRSPAFIRDQAMKDPRMKYVPLLQEHRFQSMVAVPILSRTGETIGVIVLHTRAPHEFEGRTVQLLVYIASLVSGAIENAQLYEQARRRIDALTGLSELAQRVAGASDAHELAAVVVTGSRELLAAELCQLLRLEPDGQRMHLLASAPEELEAPSAASAAELMLAALGERDERPDGKALWPTADVRSLLVTPLVTGGQRIGLLCVGSSDERGLDRVHAEIARAIAHLTAIAMKRAELIERLTSVNIIRDLFEAVAAGATAFAAAKAAEIRCDLTAPYLMLYAGPAGDRDPASGEWRTAAEDVGRSLGALVPRSAIDAGPGPMRALVAQRPQHGLNAQELLEACRELGSRTGSVIGISQQRDSPADSADAYREARDAATIGRALLPGGGALAYSEVGAYRYLVQIGAGDAPRDRMRTAVDVLIAYDSRRRTELLTSLERYLSERRSMIESARALYIHPNTLRQRLARIEELTGLKLEEEDLLSLELAIKLARLHGRPDARGA
jgi:GAF domain-containing protein